MQKGCVKLEISHWQMARLGSVTTVGQPLGPAAERRERAETEGPGGYRSQALEREKKKGREQGLRGLNKTLCATGAARMPPNF